jgi:hypothetical protein
MIDMRKKIFELLIQVYSLIDSHTYRDNYNVGMKSLIQIWQKKNITT